MEQILKATAAADQKTNVLIVQSFSPSLSGIIQHDVTILTDLQRGKYALVPCDRGLPRIQMVDVLQRGLQMLYSDVANIRHYFWGFEPVRTPLFGQPWYAVQALTKGFIDTVQDGLAQYQVNIVHLGLLIVELARAATQQWGAKVNAVLLHEYQFGQFDMGVVIHGELLYTRYLPDISQLAPALLETQERFDLYYPGKKLPSPLPIYLTGQGPLCREIVLRADLQLVVNEATVLKWWPWPDSYALENATSLPHSEVEGTVTEFRKEVEEHWSLLLADLAPAHEAPSEASQAVWRVIAMLVLVVGVVAVAFSVYIAHQYQPALPTTASPSVPVTNGADAAHKSKALAEEVGQLQREEAVIKNSVQPVHNLIQALQGPWPAHYHLDGILALTAADKQVHFLLSGPRAQNVPEQLIKHLQQFTIAQGGTLLHNVRPDTAGRTLFRSVQPGKMKTQIYLVGELSR